VHLAGRLAGKVGDVTKGVLYVAFGRNAEKEARLSCRSLTNYHAWPISCISDRRQDWARTQTVTAGGKPGRWAKVHLDTLSPYYDTLFLDADTRVRSDLGIGFRLLQNGWDFVMVPSGERWQDFDNATQEERAETLMELPLDTLTLNTGVMWFRKTTRVRKFFAEWRRQWERWKDVDQAAFARALEARPMALFVLGWPYNDVQGTVVMHRFGMAA